MFKFLLFLFCFWGQIFVSAQKPTQTIRGVISNQITTLPISNATVVIKDLNIKTTSDSLGNFIFNQIPVGNYSLFISCIGFETLLVKEVFVISAKETNLAITLKESINNLSEVTVRSSINKQHTLNNTAVVSGKMLSVEEARRFAGGFDDPARLVATFAGIASNIGNNGISVRGNNPQYLQWKLEGIEISNPNHFADNSTFGGGVLSALSSHNLGNSDFFSGAFSAEYSNAIGGIFDMNIRKGTSTKKERTVQIGLTGIDYAEEGPFKKGGKATYIYNYRYATLGLLRPLLPEDGGKGVQYQDVSFKLHFPAKKGGSITIWGIGLNDFTGINAKKDTLKWETLSDRQTHTIQMNMGTLGLQLLQFINKKSILKTNVAVTTNKNNFTIDQLQKNESFISESIVNNTYTNLIVSTALQTRFGQKHFHKIGISATRMHYQLQLKKYNSTIVNENGQHYLWNAYTNSTIHFSQNFTANIGVQSQLFSLSNQLSIEPRMGLKYQFQKNQIISFGYGLHSRLEKLHTYFAKNPLLGNNAINTKLGFTKAHHFVIAYNRNLNEQVHFKTELYYQYLFNVPVIGDSSFSMINVINEWFINQPLINKGKGRNFGIEMSVDRYLLNGVYYSTSISIYNSTYKGGDGIWRNTRFNRNILWNILGGKEWSWGKEKAKTFGLNIRCSYQGGDRHSPIHLQRSIQKQEVVFDESNAFSRQLKASFTTHFTLLYRIHKKKTTKELALKVLNAGQYKEFYNFEYNYINKQVQELRQAIIIPNISYKIEF
ncbi:MAG: TonB-dependent receptor [Chitinophagaceae bacterium]